MNAEADHDVSAGMMDYHPPSSATDGVDCVQMENIIVTDVTTDDSKSSICDTNDLDLDDLTSDDEEVLLIRSDDHINHLERLEEIRPLSNDTMMDKPVIHVVDSEMSKIAQFICQFFTLLQLCYHVSDQALNVLLSFFHTILTWITCFFSDEDVKRIIRKLIDTIPKNVYFLQKAFSKDKAHVLKKYIVCPDCHSIYPLSYYSLKSLNESPFCTYRKKHKTCKELLFRKVKVGSNYKLMSKRIYLYIPIKMSLLNLVSRENFLKKCEMWR